MSLIYDNKDGNFYGKCSKCGRLTAPLGADRETAWNKFQLAGWIRPGHSSERKHICFYCAPAKIIAVDFDGCLVQNAYPDIGAPNWDVIAQLRREQDLGAKVILWTCRRGALLDAAVQACYARLGVLPFSAINENLPEVVAAFGGDTRKIFANEYWDDRAVRMPENVNSTIKYKNSTPAAEDGRSYYTAKSGRMVP